MVSGAAVDSLKKPTNVNTENARVSPISSVQKAETMCEHVMRCDVM